MNSSSREYIYIILCVTRHNESINDDKNDDLHSSNTCLTCLVNILLTTSQSITNDFTMTRQLWFDHVNSDILLIKYRFYSRRYSRPLVSETWTFYLCLDNYANELT